MFVFKFLVGFGCFLCVLLCFVGGCLVFCMGFVCVFCVFVLCCVFLVLLGFGVF